MGSRRPSRFALQVAGRVAIIVAGAGGVAFAATHTGYAVTGVLSALAVLGASWSLIRLVDSTNRDIARMLSALRHHDLGQSVAEEYRGAGFNQLRQEVRGLIDDLRAMTQETQATNQFLSHLIDHVPIPLLSVLPDGRTELLNKAARRLLSLHRGHHLTTFEVYGATFTRALATLPAGQSAAVELDLDGSRQRAVVSVSEIISQGQSERLIALLNIQSELDIVQMGAWRDLVRVLTHEIMNSITPITSLARTAASLASEAAAGGSAPLIDLRDAIDTVARRADGVMHFVQSYRQVTRVPAPEPRQVRLGERIAALERLLAAEWPRPRLRLQCTVEPPDLEATVDPDQMDQVLLNLLRNAAEAACAHAAFPQVSLRARPSRIGKVLIEIDDNGPGVPPERRDEVFLPFFTTKAEGTGVGLSLARQIVLAHGGSLTVGDAPTGGARFTLVV